MAVSDNKRANRGKHIALALAGTMLAAITAPGAHAATYIWTTGNYAPGVTSPSPLVSPDILTIDGASNKIFGTDFTNASGQVDWLNGSLYFGSGAVVTNNSLWRALGNNGFYQTTGGGTFVNGGTFRKETGTGITTINTAFANSGTVDAVTGTIQFTGSGKVFNAGSSFTGAGNIEIAGGAAFNGGFNSTNLDFVGGTYTGTGAVLSGTADFVNGNFAGDWTVASGAALNISGASNKIITGDFTNDGTTNWSDGALYLQGGATLANDGSWIATGDNGFYLSSGGGTFINDGLLQKTGGTGVTTIATAFVNNGVIDAATGTIRFASSGQVFNSGTSFTGAGTNEIGGSAAFNGAISSTNLDFVGSVYTGTAAVLSGTADFVNGSFSGDWTLASGTSFNILGASNKIITGSFTNDGAVNWSNGALYLQGGASVRNNGSWIGLGDNSINLSSGGGTFYNDGLFQKNGATGLTNIASPFVNNGVVDAATGTIRFTGSGHVFNAGTSFTGAGINQISGSAAFNGGFSATNLDFVSGTYTGTGAILSGTADYSAGSFAGDWTIGSGASFNISGASNKIITGSFTNDGTVNWSEGALYLQGGATAMNNGRLTATGDNGLYLSSGGGTLTNTGVIEKTGGTGTTTIGVPFTNEGMVDVRSGTIALPSNFVNDGTLAGSATYSLSGTLTNAGIIAPGAGGAGIGTLTLNGNFAQTSTGLLDFQFGAGGIADLFVVNGTASLNGILGLTCVSCTFSVGDIFTLLDSSGDLTGVFSSVSTSGFNTGFAYSLLYDTTGDRVQLRIDNLGTSTPPGAVPEPASWLMMILGFGAVGGTMRRRARSTRIAFA